MSQNDIKKYSILILKTILAIGVLLFGYYWLSLRPDIMIWDKVQKNEQILIAQKNYLSQSRIIMVELMKTDVNVSNYPTYLKKTLELLYQINNTALEKRLMEISYDPVLSFGKKNIQIYNRNILSGIYDITEKNKLFLEEQKEFLNNLNSSNFEKQKELLMSDQSITLLTKHTNLVMEYDYWLKKITILKQSL